MTAYAMTIKGHDIVGYWENCTATTLTGAKREAARRFGDSFLHHTIQVAINHGRGPGDYQVVAQRPVDGKWSDVQL